MTAKVRSLLSRIKNIQQAQGLFLYDLNATAIYYKCFYCGSNWQQTQEIPFSKHLKLGNYLTNYTNFQEHVFRIGYVPFVPFFWCKAAEDCTGPEANLLKLLSKMLNFKYTLVNYEHLRSEKGTWRTLVDGVHNKSIDWAVGGISLSPERSSLTDLTRVIHSESYKILYHCRGIEIWDSWNQIFKPFNFLTWMCILMVFFGTVVLLKYLPDAKKLTNFKYFEMMIRALVEQPMPRLAIRSMRKRLVFIAWLYSCIILLTGYKSKVVSMMIYSETQEFTSIQELLHQGYTFQVSSLDWSVLKENWEASSKDKTFRGILKNTKSDLSICEALENMLTDKVAYIDETSTMLYQVKSCQVFIDGKPSTELCFINKEVFPSYHIWPMQLGAGYRYRFSHIIETLHSAGILNFWYTSVFEKMLVKTTSTSKVKSTSGLTFTTMMSTMSVLGFGLGISLILFLVELMWYYSDSIFKVCRKLRPKRSK